MSRVRTGVALVAGLVGILAASPAFSEVDAPVLRAQELTQAGRAQEAYALLTPLAPGRVGDVDFDYALGLAALDSGRPAEAIIALQRVLAVNPNQGSARAELARAYAMAGDADTARQEFATLRDDPTIPDPVRRRFASILSDLDREVTGQGRNVSAFVEAGVGHDSNVNSATAETSLIIPLFSGLGPAALSGTATETPDEYLRLEGGVSLLQGIDRQTRLFASLLGSLKENESQKTFNTGAITGSFGLSRTLVSRSAITGSVSHQTFFLDGRTYRNTTGAALQYSVPLESGGISASVQYYALSYPADALRDGERYALGLGYSWAQGSVAGQVGKESIDSPAGQHMANEFGGLSAAYEVPLGRAVSLTLSGALEGRRYESADPLFLTPRGDEQLDLSAGLNIRIREGLFVRPQVTSTTNKSTIALYEYDRTTAAVSLRAEF